MPFMKSSIDKDILRLTIPNIISNITVPLLGMVDMSIVGHLNLDVYIGAIATAALIFNFIYWSFSFLRMGTSGFTAQAYGAGNDKEAATILLRSMLIAFVGGFAVIILQTGIFDVAFFIIKANHDVITYAGQYFDIYIWAAPAVLGMYAFSGWFIGMQDARTPMFIAVAVNIVNICLSLLFVYVLKMKIEGVALGSAIAQIFGFFMAFFIWYFKYKNIRVHTNLYKLFDIRAYIPFFKVNVDIFIRTMLLIAVTVFFTSASAKMGNIVLAANALLMQLFTLFSYIMDGFAYAAEALTGRFIGSGKKYMLQLLIKKLFIWGGGLAVLFTLGYGLFATQILGLLTDKSNIIAVCEQYKIWVLFIPVAGFSAFLWDGIFIGATASRLMRNSMFISACCFFLIYFILNPVLGNNALWLAFIIYLSMRGIVQALMYKKISV